MVARMYDLPARSMRDRVSPEEWEARVELACAYRVAWHFGWYSQIFNHISYKIPGNNEEFLLNPYGFLYREITASSLVKIDLEGNTLDGSPHGVIQAGWVIHSAVHKARSDVKCIVHTHSKDGIAVSAQKWGLLPVNMAAILFHNRVSYHDYEGPSIDTDERQRLASKLGTNNVLILRNHGLITCGPDIADAMWRHYQLEAACTAQVAALSGGYENLYLPSDEMLEQASARSNRPRTHEINWAAHRRLADDLYPGYDQ
jgi:ribulose-5-phosphate 4-epimerase/fuculose-1-phosphate aldolase